MVVCEEDLPSLIVGVIFNPKMDFKSFVTFPSYELSYLEVLDQDFVL